MLLIGSQALKIMLDGDDCLGYKFWRESKDYDYIATRAEAEALLGFPIEADKLHASDGKGKECWIVDRSKALQHLMVENYVIAEHEVANLAVCFMIKAAHKHFYLGKYKKSFKHLDDYSRLREILVNITGKVYTDGLEKSPFTLMWRDELKKEYDDIRLSKVPSLDKTKEDFFGDKVVKYEDHDSVHIAVAFNLIPAYVQCLSGPVMFDVEKFKKLDYTTKLQMVVEESMVLAWERCLSPILHNNFNVPAFTPDEAFKYALVRVATNITSGEFRDFAAKNFHHAFAYYEQHGKGYEKRVIAVMEEIKTNVRDNHHT